MMETTLSELNKEISTLQAKRRALFDEALDGRTQRWLSEKTSINEARISACISGVMEFTADELQAINKALGTKFKA